MSKVQFNDVYPKNPLQEVNQITERWALPSKRDVDVICVTCLPEDLADRVDDVYAGFRRFAEDVEVGTLRVDVKTTCLSSRLSGVAGARRQPRSPFDAVAETSNAQRARRQDLQPRVDALAAVAAERHLHGHHPGITRASLL